MAVSNSGSVGRGKQFGPYTSLTESEGSWKINIANTPVEDAHKWATELLLKKRENIDDVLPDFKENYMKIQKATKAALDMPRIEMPVVNPGNDMERFQRDLEKGRLDIVKPWAMGHFYAPKTLDKWSGQEFLKLGLEDGHKTDDYVKARWTRIKAERLLPTQSEIWLDNVMDKVYKHGPAVQGKGPTETTIIVSREGYILDGHHRYGQCMLANPKLRILALYVPIDIKTLIAISRSYGNAIGNKQKA